MKRSTYGTQAQFFAAAQFAVAPFHVALQPVHVPHTVAAVVLARVAGASFHFTLPLPGPQIRSQGAERSAHRDASHAVR
jgi:hypothetical protein